MKKDFELCCLLFALVAFFTFGTHGDPGAILLVSNLLVFYVILIICKSLYKLFYSH